MVNPSPHFDSLEPGTVPPTDEPSEIAVGSEIDRVFEHGEPAARLDAASHAPGGATQSQLRRFIKSRAWVPMHELRRRFEINGADDEMTPIDVDGHRIFVGLPDREAQLIAELIRQNDVGYELVLDPVCPAIAGLYPMRPVVRG